MKADCVLSESLAVSVPYVSIEAYVSVLLLASSWRRGSGLLWGLFFLLADWCIIDASCFPQTERFSTDLSGCLSGARFLLFLFFLFVEGLHSSISGKYTERVSPSGTKGRRCTTCWGAVSLAGVEETSGAFLAPHTPPQAARA